MVRVVVREVLWRREDGRLAWLEAAPAQLRDRRRLTVMGDEQDSDEDNSTAAIDLSPIPLDRKKVKKTMKKTLKKAPNKSMKLKQLRKVLSEQLGIPKNSRKQLKEFMLEQAANKKKKKKDSSIILDGKFIKLVP